MEHIDITHLNEKYENMQLALQASMLTKTDFKQKLKQYKSRRKAEQKSTTETKKNIFVLNFYGDARATAVASLREEITAVLTVAKSTDEVVVRMESVGGLVYSYGFAASQLLRITEKNIPLTVSVDKLAASGGYLMACVANRIIAAHFAVIGSIGVVGQLPNLHRFLKKHEIDFEQHTAGEFKRTLTIFGENTDKGRERFKQEIEDTHILFKDFVKRHRDIVDIDQVSTGKYWYGTRALDIKLVDELRTSDDYLREASQSAAIYEIAYVRKRSIIERILSSGSDALLKKRMNWSEISRDTHSN